MPDSSNASLPESMTCYVVTQRDDGTIAGRVERRPLAELPPGDVLIRVACSSLNYKDALAATGHPGVAKRLPHVPGVDAGGTVVESAAAAFRPGDAVFVTGYDLGAGRWGGWAEFVRVPAEWVVPLPAGLTLPAAMALGTAGFTAALSVDALQRHDVRPDAGDVVVTGATGGVGSVAVRLLARLGYRVVAVSGKPERRAWLERLGASEVIPREAVVDASDKPLLAARWAGAVDCVGGVTLATILRSTRIGGCVAASGLVGGVELPLTVHPFILRGVTLAGIDTAWCPRERRLRLWDRLAGDWKLDDADDVVREVALNDVGTLIDPILHGHMTGRVRVRIDG